MAPLLERRVNSFSCKKQPPPGFSWILLSPKLFLTFLCFWRPRSTCVTGYRTCPLHPLYILALALSIATTPRLPRWSPCWHQVVKGDVRKSAITFTWKCTSPLQDLPLPSPSYPRGKRKGLCHVAQLLLHTKQSAFALCEFCGVARCASVQQSAKIRARWHMTTTLEGMD